MGLRWTWSEFYRDWYWGHRFRKDDYIRSLALTTVPVDCYEKVIFRRTGQTGPIFLVDGDQVLGVDNRIGLFYKLSLVKKRIVSKGKP